MRRGRLAATVGLLGLVVTGAARGSDGTTPPPTTPPPSAPAAWLPALMSYAKDPLHNTRVLREYRGADPATLPPAIVLALGDARMRAGQRRAAEQLLTLVTQMAPNDVWAPIARVGLAWLALLGDDVELARAQEDALLRTPQLTAMGEVTIALTESRVDPRSAIARLDAAAVAEGASDALRPTARWAAALAAWWAGDTADAAARFARLADSADAGPFADDARYAAAIARWALGDTAGARDALTALAAEPGSGPDVRTTRARLLMARSPLLRDGLARLRRTPLLSIESQLSVVLDGNGPALAQAALALLDGPPPTPEELHSATAPAPAPPGGTTAADDADATMPAAATGDARDAARRPGAAPAERAAAGRPAAAQAAGWRSVAWTFVGIVVLVGGLAFARRRARTEKRVIRQRPGWPSTSAR